MRLLPRKANTLFSLASKLKKPEQLRQCCLRRLGSPHNFYRSCWKNEISTFVVKFIAVCHASIYTQSVADDLQQAWLKSLVLLQRHSPRVTWPTLATALAGIGISMLR